MRTPLKALKVGPLLPTKEGAVKKYDFTHLLPPDERKQLRMYLQDTETWGHDLYVRVLDADGNRVGRVDASYTTGFRRYAKVENSDLNEEYWGRGIGKAMYLAVYVYTMKVRKATRVTGWTHSSMAARVHTALARDYRLVGYRPKRTGCGYGEGAYDNAWGPYSYKLA